MRYAPATLAAAGLLFSSCSFGVFDTTADEATRSRPAAVADERAESTSLTATTLPTSIIEPIERADDRAEEEANQAGEEVDVSETPIALAFASEDDMVGLFETRTATGVLALSTSPASSFSGHIINDGTLVEVQAVEWWGDQLWVLIADPVVPSEPLGWTLAADLVDTDQVLADRPWGAVRRFSRIVGSSGDSEMPHVVDQPAVDAEVIAEPTPGTLVHTSGNRVRDAGGATWLELSEPGTNAGRGWILSTAIETISSMLAISADGSPAPMTHPGGWETGAPATTPSVVGGCGAFQVTIGTTAEPGTGVGSHVRLGPNRPSAPWEGDPDNVSWSFGAGEAALFIPPGDEVTLIIPAAESTEWYFMYMDAGNTAPWITRQNGDPRLRGGTTLRPVRDTVVNYDAETCSAS